jgi:chromosome segregation ATPase
MKRLGSAALISLLASLSLIACENASRLDQSVKAAEQKADKAEATPPAKADHSGSVEDRVARLEANYDRYAEALDFLGKVYEQQKNQQKQQQERAQREDPDPDAVFAVDVTPDVKLGEVEGPPSALITIVEAWDFA